MQYMTSGFKKKVSLVIVPIDDFTEKVITGAVLIMYTERGKQPSIRKQDGYHVFCDLTGDTVRICADGPFYQKQTVEFPVGDISKAYTIRMIPNASYPIPAGATCVRGKIKSQSRIRLFFPKQKKSYKLLYDYQPELHKNNLSVFCTEPVQLEGKTLCIANSEGKQEFFRVKEQHGENCRMEMPLAGEYRKIGTSIYPVYETYADEEGNFYLPIRSIPVENGSCSCLLANQDGTEEIRREIILQSGKENKITDAIYRKEDSGRKENRT